MTTYAYLRISTSTKSQTTENQSLAITSAGFAVDVFYSEEGVSGSIKAVERPVFKEMLSKLQRDDVLIMTMLDRLGRDAADILNTIALLKSMGVKARILQFDALDITSPIGKMILTCVGAMAELERNLLVERTNAGLERAKANGIVLGAPLSLTPKLLAELILKKEAGATYDVLAAEYKLARNTIARNVLKWSGKMEDYKAEFLMRARKAV